MAYLIYPPETSDTLKPSFAINHLDPIDEIILQDLRKWGWRIDEHTNDDLKWLTAVQEYHTRMQVKKNEVEDRKPSLWEFWREENARRLKEEGDKGIRKPNRLMKRPRLATTSSGNSRRNSASKAVKERTFQNLPTSRGSTELEIPQVQENPKQESRKVTGTRQKTTQTKGRVTDAKKSAKPTADQPFHDGRTIFKYGTETSIETQARLGEELLQDIKDWIGIGILKTTQVSVVSEEGIAVDERGAIVHFPPKWDLGLFPWEEDISRSSSKKSQEPNPAQINDLKCVTDSFSEGFHIADKHQEKNEPDQENHRIG
ncbi:hypothetical protein N0V90_003701 [Kalmusia sp. IMI 367209]|nr:hypothetical protein N0V90_003701 [Kalmusia sp. IMI 367209]